MAEVGKRLEILSIPRILLGILSGFIWGWYGLEIQNHWMLILNIIGIIMNTCLVYVIITIVPKKKL